MADNATTQRRQQGLEQAASVVFALMGIVPFLLFTFTLWQVGAIHRTLAQACLVLTLVLMLLGFWLFRSMLGQLSEVVKEVARIAQAAARSLSPTCACRASSPSSVAERTSGGAARRQRSAAA